MQIEQPRKEAVRSQLEGLVVEFWPDRIAKVVCASNELGYTFHHANTWERFLEIAKSKSLQLVILANTVSSSKPHDYRTDLDIAKLLHTENPGCKILFVINNGFELNTCYQAIDFGVCGFINIQDPDFHQLLTEQIEQVRERVNKEKVADDYTNAPKIFDQTGIATQSTAMYKLLAQANKAAIVCDAPIIIEGESGTGKQLLAEAIHKMDPKRSLKPFLSVNCAAITGTLAESSLFGHKKGAFTGATEDRLGYFRSANGGTLMLDEISELEPSLQPKLLRALQEDCVLPVGDDREHPIDVRIIASSNKPLAEEVAARRFRLDLYQRLNVIKLHIPALRERLEDIPLLVQYFLKKYKHYYAQTIRTVDPSVYAVLQRAVGQGNIRELENIIRQSLVFKNGGTIFTADDLPDFVRASASSNEFADQVPADLTNHIMQQLSRGHLDFDILMQQFEHQILEMAMKKLGIRGTRLAEHLNMNRRTLYHKLRKHNLTETE
ncbi:MAG: sigma-54 dependent transcriptional regulator [Phycisphaerae bacterium]